MNSALTLSSQYIISNIIIYLQYVQHVGQKLLQREINASGEPTSQVITNWDATRGTPLGQRGATRDKSPRTEVYIGSTITEFPMIPQCSLTCSALP